jgi:serine/threonine protein kinase
MPKGRKKLTVDTDEANEVVERNRSFNISHTGTFVLPNEGVRINAQGMKVIEGKEYAETGAKRLMTNFADFEMLEHVGHGGGGVVHKALHVPTQETVAVKTINVLDADKRHQLVRELKTLWKASSPYIVDFKGAFFDEDHLYVVLEYMDGGSLQDVLRKAGKIPEAIIGQTTQSIVRGLAYLKKLKMVHRDIKPGNILISRQGQVKLTDFGVTGDLSAAAAEASTFVGTAKYMSPEQLSGRSYGYPADVWALGICLMELATGEHPYSKYKCANQMELLLALENESLPELPASMFSPDFCDFTSRCLTMEPDDRATVEALLEMPFLRLSGGQDIPAWLSQLDVHKTKKASPAKPPPRRKGLSVPRSFTIMSPVPSPQQQTRKSGTTPSPQAAAAREMALRGMTAQAAAMILASPDGSVSAEAAGGARAASRERKPVPVDGSRSASREGRPPLPHHGAGARPARRTSPMKAARARTPDNGAAGFSRAGYGSGNGNGFELPALAAAPAPAPAGGGSANGMSTAATSAVFGDPGYPDDSSGGGNGSSPYRPRALHNGHHMGVGGSPVSSPASADESGPHYDGASRAGGYRSRLAAWRRQQSTSTAAMAYGNGGLAGTPPLPTASPVGSNVAAADVAAAEAWAILRQQDDTSGRPISGGNVASYMATQQAGRLSPGTFAAAAKAYAGRPTMSPGQGDVGPGMHATHELAALESPGGVASSGSSGSGSGGAGATATLRGTGMRPQPQRSPSASVPTDQDEQKEMLRMLEQSQSMVRRLEQDTRTGR